MIPRGAWWALLAWLAVPAGAQTYAPNLARPPAPADLAALAALGDPAAARDLLGGALTRAYQPGASPTRLGANGQAAFQAWLRLWQWQELLARTSPPARPGGPRAPYADLVPTAMRQEWLSDAELSRLLFDNLSPHDNAAEVLRLLAQIRQAHPAAFAEYRALAVAIALVYDQPRPAAWPHPQVKPATVPIQEPAPADWFAFWVKQNEAATRLVDLRKLGPGEIKFVVDAPLAPAEFDWARANVRFTRTDFAKAYPSVRYAGERASQGEYDWSNGAYTLDNIRQNGGICIDQAYFAAVAGKARGLPTLLFCGQGTNGGHAWFAYLRTDERWALDCGRTDDGYVVGEAWDPQTWRFISDHELALLAERFRERPEFAASQNDLVLARLFLRQDNLPGARKALDSALAVCPRNPEAWAAKAAFLDATGAPLAEQRALREAAARQFAALPDLRAAHTAALADLAERDGDPALAARLRQQIITQTRRARPDLAAAQIMQNLAVLAGQLKYADALRAYEQEMQAAERNAGGSYFHGLVHPFVSLLLANRKFYEARDALQTAQRTLAPASGSVLEHDLRSLEAELAAAEAAFLRRN